MIPLAISAGFVAGVMVNLITYAFEHSRIAFGDYALYGNGAIIVLIILAPFALYPGWAWLLSPHRDGRLEAALYTIGLHLGVGMGSVINAVLNPEVTSMSLSDMLPGILMTGTLTVIPAALVGAATLWLVRSGRLAITPLTTAFVIVIAALTVPLFGFGLGILSGGAVGLALERPERRITIGIALLVLCIVVANVLTIAFLFAPTGPTP
jgi:hypothetical protein